MTLKISKSDFNFDAREIEKLNALLQKLEGVRLNYPFEHDLTQAIIEHFLDARGQLKVERINTFLSSLQAGIITNDKHKIAQDLITTIMLVLIPQLVINPDPQQLSRLVQIANTEINIKIKRRLAVLTGPVFYSILCQKMLKAYDADIIKNLILNNAFMDRADLALEWAEKYIKQAPPSEIAELLPWLLFISAKADQPFLRARSIIDSIAAQHDLVNMIFTPDQDADKTSILLFFKTGSNHCVQICESEQFAGFILSLSKQEFDDFLHSFKDLPRENRIGLLVLFLAIKYADENPTKDFTQDPELLKKELLQYGRELGLSSMPDLMRLDISKVDFDIDSRYGSYPKKAIALLEKLQGNITDPPDPALSKAIVDRFLGPDGRNIVSFGSWMYELALGAQYNKNLTTTAQQLCKAIVLTVVPKLFPQHASDYSSALYISSLWSGYQPISTPELYREICVTLLERFEPNVIKSLIYSGVFARDELTLAIDWLKKNVLTEQSTFNDDVECLKWLILPQHEEASRLINHIVDKHGLLNILFPSQPPSINIELLNEFIVTDKYADQIIQSEKFADYIHALSTVELNKFLENFKNKSDDKRRELLQKVLQIYFKSNKHLTNREILEFARKNKLPAIHTLMSAEGIRNASHSVAEWVEFSELRTGDSLREDVNRTVERSLRYGSYTNDFFDFVIRCDDGLEYVYNPNFIRALKAPDNEEHLKNMLTMLQAHMMAISDDKSTLKADPYKLISILLQLSATVVDNQGATSMHRNWRMTEIAKFLEQAMVKDFILTKLRILANANLPQSTRLKLWGGILSIYGNTNPPSFIKELFDSPAFIPLLRKDIDKIFDEVRSSQALIGLANFMTINPSLRLPPSGNAAETKVETITPRDQSRMEFIRDSM
ncbi:MAG TPA: hypothetical protein VLG38_07225, partial [Gammaproteobacteria bacterium]|nr:hypothetical protein [Gammaproteobacteria bacterium]